MDDAGNHFAIGVEESPRRFGRNEVQQAALGDVAPFEVVRAQPVADDNVRALLVEGGGDVGADEPCAARNHVHARSPSLGPASAEAIDLSRKNPKELLGAALPVIRLQRYLRAFKSTLHPSPRQ